MEFSQALFKIPFCAGRKQPVEPYRRFAPKFELGFSDPQMQVSVQQRGKSSALVSAPDHAFEFDVEVSGPNDSKWLSLEGGLDTGALFAGAQLTVLLSLKSSLCEQFSLVLRILRPDGSFEDMTVGALTPQTEDDYSRTTLSRPLDPLAAILKEEGTTARLILFAPHGRAIRFSLSMFNVFITKPYGA